MKKALLLGSIGVLTETSELQRQAYNQALKANDIHYRWNTGTYCKLLQEPGGKKRLSSFDGGILSKLTFQPKGYTDFGFGVNSDLGDLGLSLNFERGLSADDKDYGSLLYALRLSLSIYDLHYGEKTTSYSLFQTIFKTDERHPRSRPNTFVKRNCPV